VAGGRPSGKEGSKKEIIGKSKGLGTSIGPGKEGKTSSWVEERRRRTRKKRGNPTPIRPDLIEKGNKQTRVRSTEPLSFLTEGSQEKASPKAKMVEIKVLGCFIHWKNKKRTMTLKGRRDRRQLANIIKNIELDIASHPGEVWDLGSRGDNGAGADLHRKGRWLAWENGKGATPTKRGRLRAAGRVKRSQSLIRGVKRRSVSRRVNGEKKNGTHDEGGDEPGASSPWMESTS